MRARLSAAPCCHHVAQATGEIVCGWSHAAWQGAEMYKAEVEIWSDATNMAILRHPDRHYPGILIQGDDLLGFCNELTRIAQAARGKVDDATMRGLELLLDDFKDLMTHYCEVAGDPGIGRQPWREPPA
jgi:hypothetical protein